MKHDTRNVCIEVLVRGKPVREYKHGDGYTYIEGRKGSDFELRIHNKTSTRILAVPSVDGLSVMDGKPASSDSSGYVIGGYGRVIIPGWRLDNEKVAKFLFEDEKRSYAEASGEGGNQGVISVMVFEEKQYTSTVTVTNVNPWHNPWGYNYYTPYNGNYRWTSDQFSTPIVIGSTTTTMGNSEVRCETTLGAASEPTMGLDSSDQQKNFKSRSRRINVSNTSAGIADGVACNSVFLAEESEEKLGVGFGVSKDHEVKEVVFEKGHCYGLISLYYDSRKGLEKRGIQVVNIPVSSRPNPFPGNDRGCVPPAGWQK